jgi:hypothetical protein
MTWETMNSEHVEALQATPERQGVYMHRLLRRLAELGFPSADPLYRRVTRADDALWDL